MTIVDEIMQRRRAIRWAEEFYDRCAAMAGSINGDSDLAHALAELGKGVMCGDVPLSDQTRRDFIETALTHVARVVRTDPSERVESNGQWASNGNDSDRGDCLPASHGETVRGDALALLTNRQHEVLRLLAVGRTMKEVASMLDITARTVAFHKYNLMTRLGLETGADLVRFAIKHDIISL